MPSHAAEPISGAAAYPAKADAPVLGRWAQLMYPMTAASLLLSMFLAILADTGSWQMAFYVASGLAFAAGASAHLMLKPLRAQFLTASQ